MTIEQLEMGLRRLNLNPVDGFAFWDESIIAYRSTVLFAINETSTMLASRNLPLDCRNELERQSILLQRCLDRADQYLRWRRLNSHTDVRACH